MSNYFDSIKKKHTHYYESYTNKINLGRPIQMGLFGMQGTSHVRMGLYYELLTAGLFGGFLVDSLIPLNDSKHGHCKPDVQNQREKTLVESKACRQGNQMNLLDLQINRYKTLQIIKSDFDIYFAFWRHEFKAIKNNTMTYLEMNKKLSQCTRVGIILHFSIILRLFESPKLKRYETEVWSHCTRLGSKLLNDFILNPIFALQHVELDVRDYQWRRYLTPRDFIVQKHQVTPFPFIIIDHKDKKQWREEFCSIIPF